MEVRHKRQKNTDKENEFNLGRIRSRRTAQATQTSTSTILQTCKKIEKATWKVYVRIFKFKSVAWQIYVRNKCRKSRCTKAKQKKGATWNVCNNINMYLTKKIQKATISYIYVRKFNPATYNMLEEKLSKQQQHRSNNLAYTETK